MMNQRWQIQRSRFDLDGEGFGTVIYRIDTPSAHYHCVIFSAYLPPEKRSDRVIADQWDVTFVLVAGDVDAAQLDELARNVPLQEAGRFDARVLVLSRANRSLRNFDRFLAALAEGQQPDPRQLAEVGYLYRTTAVYGNGKFGIADFGCLQDNPDFNQPFSAQMFTVYLLRHFSIEQIEHMARALNPQRAVQLAPALQRYLGVGNATGLGMAPFDQSPAARGALDQHAGNRPGAGTGTIGRTCASGPPSPVAQPRPPAPEPDPDRRCAPA